MAPVARGVIRLSSAAAMVLLVFALMLRNRRRRGRGRSGRHGHGRPQLDDASHEHSADAMVGAHAGPGGARVRFGTNIAIFNINNLTMLPQEQKAECWWQQDDFNDFLNVRVQIGRAYQEAARKLGVDIEQVSSVGSHGNEGYKAMIEAFPELAHESRRGLGLGRSRQRARNRDAYIAAVLAEQERQREDAWEDSLDDNEDEASKPFELDVEALAAVAANFSRRDRAYAAQLARQHFEQHEEKSSCQMKPLLVHQQDLDAAINRLAAGPKGSSQLDGTPVKLADQQQTCAGKNSSKGFGLSRDRLQEAGLSPSGHALSLYQRLRRLPPAIDFRNAGATTSENDEDEDKGEDSLVFNGDEAGKDWYHSLKFVRTMSDGRGMQFKVAAPLGIETQAYGTRQEYRNWRTHAKLA